MASGWDVMLHDASYKGVVFDVMAIRDQFGRELDRREYPARDGAEVQDRSQRPTTTVWTVVVLSDQYPDKLFELQSALVGGGPAELIHPIWGSIQAAVDGWEVTTSADEAIDSAVLEITFVEHRDEAAGPFVGDSLASRASAARSAADAVDVARAAAGDAGFTDASAAAGAATAIAVVYVDELEADATWSAADITAQINKVQAAIETARSYVSDYTTGVAFGLEQSLVMLSSTVQEFAFLVLNSLPPLQQVRVNVDMPLLLWVQERYGSSARVGEVLALNSIPDPLLVPAGTWLWVYAA